MEFEKLTEFAIQVMIGNETTAAMLLEVTKNMSEQEAESFIKFVAGMVVMPQDMRVGFCNEMEDEDADMAFEFADMICEELRIWEHSPMLEN